MEAFIKAVMILCREKVKHESVGSQAAPWVTSFCNEIQRPIVNFLSNAFSLFTAYQFLSLHFIHH